MRTNLRTQFDSGATYYQMLELARIVESENFHENSGTEAKNTNIYHRHIEHFFTFLVEVLFLV